MKILKILGILIVLIVLVAVSMGIFGPDSTHVERTINVNASKDIVFGEIVDLKKMDEWGPWKAGDPDASYTYEGEMGTVGSVSLWEGEKVGKGRQEITGIEKDQRVESKLSFIEPFEAEATSYFDLADGENGGTKVTWGFDGQNTSFMQKMMASMMDMDKQIGGMFTQGLNSLSNTCQTMMEVRNNEMAKYDIQETFLETKYYIGTMDTVKLPDLESYFGNSFAAVGAAVGQSGLEPVGPPSAVFFMFDEENGITVLSAGFPLSELKEIEGFRSTEVGGKALHLAYYGPYDASAYAHYAIDTYMKANRIEQGGLVIEEYVTDPGSEPDPNKWLTNIYYLIN